MAVAVLLAGGLARRMGGGDRIRPQVDAVALSANGDPARFAAFGLPMLADPLPGNPGPLAGVLAGMRWAAALGAAEVLSVPADTPFLPPDLVARLAAARAPIACAASLGRTHPVVALWPAALADALEAALREGKRSVADWAAGQGVVCVAFEAAGADPFFNVNSPADLAEAEALLASPAAARAGCRAPGRPAPVGSNPPATPSKRRSR
jgi:molybdopterin-guanine dinucleotide biosynthesis protein A